MTSSPSFAPSLSPSLAPSSTPTLTPTLAPSNNFPTTHAQVTGQDLWISFVLYFSVGIFCIFLYIFLRRFPFFYQRVYYPLYNTFNEKKNNYTGGMSRDLQGNFRRPPDRKSIFGWVFFLCSSKRDEEVLEFVGLDAYVTLRLNKFAMKIFGIWIPISLFILAPIYAKRRYNPVFLDAITLSNLTSEDQGIFVLIFVCMVVFIALVSLLMKLEYEHFINIRFRYLANREICKETFTVVIEKVPKELISRNALKRYFDVVLGTPTNLKSIGLSDQTAVVTHVELVPKLEFLQNLEALQYKRDALLLQLENAEHMRRQEKSVQILTFDTQFDRSVELDEMEEKALDEIIASELSDNVTGKRSVLNILNSISCSLFGGQCVEKKNAVLVNKVEYLQKRLKTIDQLLEIMQNRYAIKVEQRDNIADGIGNGNFNNGLSKFSNDSHSPLISSSSQQANTDSWSDIKLEEAQKLLDSKEKSNPPPRDISDRIRMFFQRFRASDDVNNGDKDFLPVAFVTFRSQYAANIVSMIAVSEQRDSMRASIARRPDDMIKANLGYSQFYKIMIGFLTIILSVALLLVFGSLVALLALATNLSNLRQNLPRLDTFLNKNEFLVIFFEQLGPILLVLAFTLVPIILLLIINIKAPISESKKRKEFFNVYYAFQVIQLFLFYQISGSLTSIIGESVLDPIEVVNLLAKTIPANSIFFIQVILIKTLFGLPFNLTRLVDVILGVILRYLVSCKHYSQEGPREKMNGKLLGIASSIHNPGDPFLASINSEAMFVHTIAITYSLIAPLFSLIGFFYCVMFQLVYRNQLLFVYAQALQTNESIGSLFLSMLNTFKVALFLMILTMMGLFGLFQQATLTTLCLVLFLVLYLISNYFQRVYSGDLIGLPLSLARLYYINDLLAIKGKLQQRNENSALEEGHEKIVHLGEKEPEITSFLNHALGKAPIPPLTNLEIPPTAV